MTLAFDFLSVLFTQIPEDMRFAITTIDRRGKISAVRTNWYAGHEIEQASDFAIETAETLNVYVGVAIFDDTFVKSITKGGTTRYSSRRGTVDEAAGIVAFIADVDFGDSGHEHSNLPANVDEAQELLNSMPFPTTFTIHSGNGIHAWWAFKEPVIFATDGDKEKIVDLSRRWQQQLIFNEKHVDSTFDIVRVLRVPGTWNRKPNVEVKPVTILSRRPDFVYTVDDFDKKSPLSDNVTPIDRKKREKNGESITSTLNVAGEEFSDAKLNRIVRAEANNGDVFLSTFFRIRKMKGGDSNSEYDMSLANYGVVHDLSDQEIVDLIVLSRQKSGRPIDRMNASYYITTIGKARVAHAGLEEIRDIEDEKETGDAENARLRAINVIRTELDIPIVRILRYVSDEPSYSIVFEEGEGEHHEVPLKTVDVLGNQSKFLMFCLGQGYSFPKVKKWEETILKPMMLAVEEIDDRPTNTLKEEWTDKIERYVLSKGVDEDFIDMTHISKSPFMRDGRLHIIGVDFNHWLSTNEGGYRGKKEAGKFLRSEIGAELKHVYHRMATTNKLIHEYCWELPESFSELRRTRPKSSRLSNMKGDENGSK